MRVPGLRLTVRRLMVAVAIVAGLLALAVAFDHEWRPDLYRLRIGRKVVITGPHVIDRWGGAVPVATLADVMDDDDEGSISGGPEVVVTTSEGTQVKLRRDEIRPVKKAW